MPKRQSARESAQATVDAAAATAQTSPRTDVGDKSILVRVSAERHEALKVIAPGRAPEEVLADLIDDYLHKNRRLP